LYKFEVLLLCEFKASYLVMQNADVRQLVISIFLFGDARLVAQNYCPEEFYYHLFVYVFWTW
jgi:hypothetical protein